ncbi:MAG: DUF4270 family protein [Bernardetiaceae bacterium]
MSVRYLFICWLCVCCCGFSLSSCDTPQEIGLELQQDQLVQTYFTDTITIHTETILNDSVRTDGTSTLLTGQVDDPLFGNYAAEGYFKVNMGTRDSLSFLGAGDVATIDSVVFIWLLETTYGDTTQPFEWGIFPLLNPEEFQDSVTHCRFNRFDVASTPLATVRYPDDLTDIRTFRMPLDPTLVSDNLKDGLLYNRDFKQVLESFRIAPVGSEAQSVLGLNGTRSRLVIYFSFPEDTVSREATLFLNKRFNHASYQFSPGAPLQELPQQTPLPSSQTNDRLYIQAGTGIAARITFPHLKRFLDEQRFRVHRAELRFTPQESSASAPFAPPSALFFFRSRADGSVATSDTGRELFVPFEGNLNQALFVNYNTNGQNYNDANITSYLQRLLDGVEANDGIILSASGNEASVNRLIVQDAQAFNASPLRLRLYYTVAQ